MNPSLTSFGAAGDVTGPCDLIDTGAVRILLDCGMFQGGREAERKILDTFSFDPRDMAFVVHGEALGAQSLREAIGAQLGWTADIPQRGQVVAEPWVARDAAHKPVDCSGETR